MCQFFFFFGKGVNVLVFDPTIFHLSFRRDYNSNLIAAKKSIVERSLQIREYGHSIKIMWLTLCRVPIISLPHSYKKKNYHLKLIWTREGVMSTLYKRKEKKKSLSILNKLINHLFSQCATIIHQLCIHQSKLVKFSP